jgi:hypothetical protein
MKLSFKNFKISEVLIITFLSFCPLDQVLASYDAVDGRISYLAGATVSTNFQETLFNNNDTVAKLGRSQSFAGLFQVLGDLNTKSSLVAELTLGKHKFLKQKSNYLDEYKLEAISFDLGYRHLIAGDFWISATLGSMYPWRITQRVANNTPYPDSEFASIYSINIGIQYEGTLDNRPVSYDLRIRKYMSNQLDDQMAIGLSLGWRFGMN